MKKCNLSVCKKQRNNKKNSIELYDVHYKKKKKKTAVFMLCVFSFYEKKKIFGPQNYVPLIVVVIVLVQ